jgi:hypothetical protein
MKIEELNEEEMYCLFAPDGTWQPMTLAHDFPTCMAVIKLLHKAGLSKSFHELAVLKGFKVMPIKITMVQNGDENKPFQNQT